MVSGTVCPSFTTHPVYAPLCRAMLSRPRGSGHATTAAEDSTSGPGRALLLRPDPVLAAFRPFDPWGELPLLPSTPVSGNHTVRRQQQQQHLRIQVQLRE